jgi:hypothetical protein
VKREAQAASPPLASSQVQERATANTSNRQQTTSSKPTQTQKQTQKKKQQARDPRFHKRQAAVKAPHPPTLIPLSKHHELPESVRTALSPGRRDFLSI